jgi:hypothetical protein
MPADNEMSERLRSALNGAALSHDGKPTGFAAVSISLLNDAADALDKAQRERDEWKALHEKHCGLACCDAIDGGRARL